MKIFNAKVVFSVLLFLLVVSTGTAWSTPIPITNPSFEEVAYGDGNYSANPTVPGWNYTGSIYLVDPPGDGTSWDMAPIPNGNQLVLIGGLGTWEQGLNEAINASSLYTLKFDFGSSSAFGPYRDFTANLYGVATAGGSHTEADLLANMTAHRAATGWETGTLTYTAPQSGTPIGKYLTIVFRAGGDSGYALLDNVRLDGTQVPEPATLMLLSLGLPLAWRKRS